MKKTLLITALCFSAATFAASPVKTSQEIAQGIDCEVFLAPYVESMVKEMSGRVVLDAGCGIAPRADIALSARLKDVASGMRAGEKLMVAAPASYGVLFTNGTATDEVVQQHIQKVLSKIGKSKDSSSIISNLKGLNAVMRATFVQTDQGLKLVTNEKSLHSGQHIWCKTPEGVIASIYHSEEEYLNTLNQAGFYCEEIKRPCFFGKVKSDMWHAQQAGGKSLGSAYINNHPFTLYYVVKRG